jgi:hypothetical protein
LHQRSYLYGVGALVLVLSACGGNGGTTPSPRPTPTVSPVLVPGTVGQYSGTDIITHVFPNPTGTQANYTAGYTFKLTRSIESAAAGAPAAIDINALTTYTTTQDPGTGVTNVSTTTDTFTNQVAVNGGTSLQEVASKSVATGIDESAGALGGGPFTKVSTTTTTYASPQINGVYPLVAGASVSEPIGRTVTASATDANGVVSDTATVFDISSTDAVNSDGSYTLVQQLSNGESQTTVEGSNGSGTIAASGPLYTLSDTIGVPVNPGTGFTIPITTYKQYVTTGATPAPTATTVAYSAADWYPGNAAPTSPFQTDTVTVKGAAASLPSACAGAIAEPNVFEIDTSTATLNIDASYATETQQSFNSNGTPVCVLRTVTTNAYNLTTGLLSQTTTETYAEVLTSLSTAATSGSLRKT